MASFALERITPMPENTDAEPRLGDVEQLAHQLRDRAEVDQAQLLGPEGLLTQLTQRVLNRALDVELAEHLGDEMGDPLVGGRATTATGTSSRRWCPSMPAGWPGSTSRSCASTPGDVRA
jgi:hypothetical protein